MFGSWAKTSDFIVDTLQSWWNDITPDQQQQTQRIQLKVDNDPESSGVRTQFLKRMVEFTDFIGKSIHQHLCLDKGYDNPTGRDAVDQHQYIPHIRRIGEEKFDAQQQKRYPARRWVVERTVGWLSKCRAILVRYDKKACNYLGMIKPACALLWYRRCWRLSTPK
jgi:transposase